MKLFVAILGFVAYLACCQAAGVDVRNYRGYQVYSVTAKTKEEYLVLFDIYSKSEGLFDFWTHPSMNSETDVMVAPEEQQRFEALLERHGMTHKVKVGDVQGLIDEEKAENAKARAARSNKGIGWDYYARYDEIAEFVTSLPINNEWVSVEVIGRSYEGRDIHAVKISTNPQNTKTVLIDANIHAREFVTSSTATWLLNELVTNTAGNADILEGINYYIIPMINPDGYEYAHTNDRMWRKTRSVTAGNSCYGCDPNRNFPFKFGGESTSSNSCSDLYKGPEALSERETKALSDFMLGLVNDPSVNLLAYISFHSYGQLWLLPWGYTAGAYPTDYSDQVRLGEAVKKNIESVNRVKYTVGTGADVLYGVGGASDDYAKSLGIKYTVTAEMRDNGRYGFILPPAQIVPNSKEIQAALRAVSAHLRNE